MSSAQESDYCFVVEDPDKNSVLLEVRPHDDAAKQRYLGVWQKMSQALQKRHQLVGTTVPEWTTWKPGEWCDQRRGNENRQQLVAWCGDDLAGFLNVWPDHLSVFQTGKGVLYVEHLAAAPGNITTDLWVRRFGRVGETLFAYAVLVSHLRGFEGRLGLHVAEDTALKFYRRLHEKCEGRLFHPERNGVVGPTPHGARDPAKTYLETTEAGATDWLEEYRRG
jgi:hypothetical protein